MLPVIPPAGLLIGIALTGAPGVAGIILARHSYSQSAFPVARRTFGAVGQLTLGKVQWTWPIELGVVWTDL
jgi:hypothetical protein